MTNSGTTIASSAQLSQGTTAPETEAGDTDPLPQRKQQGIRLKEAREKAGYNEGSEAARALGVPIPTYHAHENGERSLVKNAALYSREFKVGVRWLLFGEPDDATTGGAQPVKVVGIAAEGMAINPATWTAPPFPAIPASPQFPDHQQVAFQVSGNSAGEFARDGTFLLCVPYAQAQRGGYRTGEVVVVEARHGSMVERVVRQIRCLPGSDCSLEPLAGGNREPIRESMTLYLVVAQYRPVAPVY
jgi:DNA-binding XRE family transcriptional regulator